MAFSLTRKALLRRLSDGHFHSGQSLSELLGVSRTAVWTAIRELEGLGLEVHAVRGRGYRLAYPLELLDRAVIEAQLTQSARASLASIEILDELESTNTRLMSLPPAEKVSGLACVAEYQTAGRGRIGRQWVSPFGGNICLSVLWQFTDQRLVAGLSLAVGVAVMRALQGVGVRGAQLKWPNDVLWQGRKLGGILLEVTGEAHGVYDVVLGIGINVALGQAQTAAIDQPWAELREILPAPVPRNRLVANILEALVDVLCAHERGGLARHIDEWRSYHGDDGKAAHLYQGTRQIAGIVAGVTDDGLLLLDTESEGLRAFASGDLRLRVVRD